MPRMFRFAPSLASFAVFVAALLPAPAHAELPPLSLQHRLHAGEPRMDANGDVADLPLRYRQAVWLPMELTGGSRLRARVVVDGKPLDVFLDSGSDTTLISEEAAHKLGFDKAGVVRKPLKLHDQHGNVIEGYQTHLGTVEIGPVRVHGVQADVAPMAIGVDGVLGFDVVGNLDIVFAADEGVVGLFAPGEGKLTARDNVIQLGIQGGAYTRVNFDDSGREATALLIDTGAPVSTLEPGLADGLRIPIDKRFEGEVAGFDGALRHSNGAYVLPHLRLGREHVDVGVVLAEQAYRSILGCDVLMRHRTLLSTLHQELRFAPMPVRPATRSKGPDGKACAGACVAVRVDKDAGGRSCVGLDVDKAWGGRRVLALVDVLDGDGNNAIGGGFLLFHVDVPAAGVHTCVDRHEILDGYGIKPGAPVSLLRFHVVDAKDDLCKAATCLTFTGLPPAAH